MHSLALPFAGPLRSRHATELRIDVNHDPREIERELEALYARLRGPGDGLHGLPVISIVLPGLVLRYREADGEHYVYVEDQVHRRLAGCVVFNRLVELDRRADPYLRSPHAKIAPAYQRRGIATAIYRWWLEGGNCLITGARQSVGAHACWRALRRSYASFHVSLRGRQLRDLGTHVDDGALHDLYTRVVLLGKGWSKQRLAERARMTPNVAAAAAPPRKRLLAWQ